MAELHNRTMTHWNDPTSLSMTTVPLDAAGDRVAWIWMADHSDTINALLFRYGARTGTPPTYRISLQGVGGDGMPDGVIAQSATFTPPADTTWNGTIRAITITDQAITRGTLYAIVVDYSSGTIDGSNNSTITQYAGVGTNDGVPYHVVDTTGSWAKGAAGMAVFGLRSATSAYGRPFTGLSNTTLSAESNRLCVKHAFPAGSGDTYKLRGVRVWLAAAAGGSMIGGIWNAAGTAVATKTLDTDKQRSPGTGAQAIEFMFDTHPTLSFGTTYYYGVERSGTDIIVRNAAVAAAGDLACFPFGAGACRSDWNGSAWNDTTTEVPPVELLFEDWAEPAGGAASVFIIEG